MGERNLQCANCGHFFSSEHPYYSEDFASVYFREQRIIVSWCLHCSFVSEYHQVKILGLIRVPYMKLTKTYHLQELINQDHWKAEVGSRGGLFGFHVLRMIWHSIDARAKLENGSKHELIHTLTELLNRLPPLYAAFAILAVSNTDQSVTLEEQIEQGLVQRYIDRDFREQIECLLQKNETLSNQAAVLEILGQAAKRG